MTQPITVNIKYKVGSEPKELRNVNARELNVGIKAFLKSISSSDADLLIDLLWTTDPERAARVEQQQRAPGSEYDQFAATVIDRLVLSDALHLQQDSKCDFFKYWWRSKTPAGGVVCMLENMLAAEKAKQKNALDQKIVEITRGVDSKAVFSTASKMNAPSAQVDAWMKRYTSP